VDFLGGLANQATDGNVVHISELQFQPIASDDVATFVAEAAVAAPINGIFEIAGPERSTMLEFLTRYLQDTKDPRKVVPNSSNQYYGGQIPNNALVPAGKAKLGAINYEKWLSNQLQKS
jgi:uncharacterized protein YbjT (DUF2867 family)